MKRIFRYLIVFFLFLPGGNVQYLQSQDPVENPGLSVSETRTFDTIALDAYKSDPVFQYGSVRQFNESLWSRIKRWFWNKMDELFGTEGSLTGMIIFFSFLALGVIALVYYLMRVQDFSPFRKADKKPGAHSELFDEQVEPEDLERKIQQAREQTDHRMAVRYLTIRMFNQLEQAGLLEIDPSTSMDQYRRQLRSGRFSGDFDMLTRYFEYIWYGEYALNSEYFNQIEQRFEHFSESLEKLS